MYKRQPLEKKWVIELRDIAKRSNTPFFFKQWGGSVSYTHLCGSISTEGMKNDVAVAQRLGITATTLDGILNVKRQGRR